MGKIIILGLLALKVVYMLMKAEPQDTDTLTKIKENEIIILGTSADYPPYEHHTLINGKDTIFGFDIDIAKKIAENIGAELEVIDMEFDDLIPALLTGDIDFIGAAMHGNEQRKESIDFSTPYYENIQRFIIRSEDKDKLKSPEDFKNHKIGAQKSTLQEDLALNQFADAEYIGISKITDLILELQNKKIDGIVIAEPVGKAYISQNSDIYMPELILEKKENLSFGINKNQSPLLDKINETLQDLIDSGEINILFEEASKAVSN